MALKLSDLLAIFCFCQNIFALSSYVRRQFRRKYIAIVRRNFIKICIRVSESLEVRLWHKRHIDLKFSEKKEVKKYLTVNVADIREHQRRHPFTRENYSRL